MTDKRASVRFASIGKIALGLAAAAMMLAPDTGASAAGLKDLPSIAPVMTCSSLTGVDLSDVSARVKGTVTISSATIVPASATNPADYCAVRGVIGPGTNSIVMRLPTNAWTQRYLQTGCGGECGNDNIGYTQSTGCVPITNGTIASATTNMGHTGSQAARHRGCRRRAAAPRRS
jgi:hypothetical protein